VTINLRNAPYSDSTASPSAPQYFSPSKVRIQIPEEDQLQKSIEEEADLGLALNANGDLGLAHASPVASPSPPVEVITIQEDDSVAEGVELVFDQSLLDGPITDPTVEFPYSNTQNTLMETSSRLQNYISSRKYPTYHGVCNDRVLTVFFFFMQSHLQIQPPLNRFENG
jgi:ubiquitin carboxyl-terminal hydrolase 34